MNDFAISDLMISDTSSIIYEYLITKKPIIIANNDYDQLHNMPDELSVLSIAKSYDGDKTDIRDLILEDLENEKLVDIYGEMLNNCFYFNDGNSTKRADQYTPLALVVCINRMYSNSVAFFINILTFLYKFWMSSRASLETVFQMLTFYG